MAYGLLYQNGKGQQYLLGYLLARFLKYTGEFLDRSRFYGQPFLVQVQESIQIGLQFRRAHKAQAL